MWVGDLDDLHSLKKKINRVSSQRTPLPLPFSCVYVLL